VVLSESATLSYKVDNYYKPEFESGIIWNDPDLNIDWRINKSEIVVSEKDTKLQPFNNFVTPF
jgi:dTDP-4-dehydrorhamnose 3,5-epimerase